jgi:flotillin
VARLELGLWVGGAALVAGFLVAIYRSFVVARPDEWLLRVRNGRMMDAGVGIVLFRWPWDAVVRFTSTIQRVGFAVDALSQDRIRVTIEGFILWSVGSKGEEPFRAFQRLGVVNLDRPPADLRSSRHLLTTPQHKAFQQLLAAAVQRLVGTKTLAALLGKQDSLVDELRERLRTTESEMAIRVDQVEILRVRAADEGLMSELSAEVEARVGDEAARARLEVSERAKKRELESAQRLAVEEAAGKRQHLEREHALRLATLAKEAEAEVQRQRMAEAKTLAEEARTLAAAKAASERKELELAEGLERIRREAEARRDAMVLVSSAEEQKSQPVRDHELSRLVTERVAEAFARLPIHDARWVTVGADNPGAGLVGLVRTVREGLTAGESSKAAPPPPKR